MQTFEEFMAHQGLSPTHPEVGGTFEVTAALLAS